MADNFLNKNSAVFYKLDLEGNYSFYNSLQNKIFGIDKEELKVFLKNNFKSKTSQITTHKAIKTGLQQNSFEVEINHNGKNILLSINEIPIVDNGKTVSLLGSITEITGDKNIYEYPNTTEDYYKLIVEAQSELVIKFDLEGRLSFVSPNFCGTFNVTPKNVLGRKFIPELHPEEKTTFENILENTLQAPFDFSHTERMKTINGWRWYSWRNRPIIKNDGSIDEIISVGRDLTEQIEYQAEIKKLAIIAQETNNAVIITDKEKNIEWVNEGFTRITGYKLSEVKGKHPGKILQGEETDKETIKKIKEAIDSGRQIKEELLNYSKSGKKYWIELNIKPILDNEGNIEKYISIEADITERKEVEEKLKLSEEKFSKAFFTAPDAIIIAGLDDAIIIEVNEGFEKIFGYSRNEVLGKSTLELGLWKYPEKRIEASRILKSKGKIRNEEGEYFNKEGKVGFGELSMDIIYLKDKVCVLSIIRDITERKKVEAELEQYQHNLKQLTNKLIIAEEEERRRIALNIHDHLGLSLAMAKINVTEAEKIGVPENLSEKISSAKKYLNDSIKNSRTITHELSPPVLYELGLIAALHWRFEQVETEHKIKTEVIDETSSLNIDDEMRNLLFRTVQEIINNALKHSGATQLTIKIKDDDNYLYLNVKDNGSGFDPESVIKNRLITKSLGLFSIKERISYLHGQLKIKSAPGKGTEIFIAVPYKQEKE